MSIIRRGAVVALALTFLSGCAATQTAPTRQATSTNHSASGLAHCDLSALPAQAREVVDQIERGGPFDNPGKDGAVFGNFEGVLPKHARGYYHEYTVATPGASNRGARRIVTGGTPLTNPPDAYYTDDHYDTFCEIEGR